MKKHFILMLIIAMMFSVNKSVIGQVDNSHINKPSTPSVRLLLRYEIGTSAFRLGEDLLILRDLKEQEREIIAIRICFNEKYVNAQTANFSDSKLVYEVG